MARPAGLPDPKLDEKLDEAFGSERPSTPTVNRLELDDARQSLDAAMAYLQTHLPRVAKGETAEITGTTKDGRPFTKKYDYAQLDDVSEAILPLLGRLGLSWRCRPDPRPPGGGSGATGSCWQYASQARQRRRDRGDVAAAGPGRPAGRR
jgi:hypothetical protein